MFCLPSATPLVFNIIEGQPVDKLSVSHDNVNSKQFGREELISKDLKYVWIVDGDSNSQVLRGDNHMVTFLGMMLETRLKVGHFSHGLIVGTTHSVIGWLERLHILFSIVEQCGVICTMLPKKVLLVLIGKKFAKFLHSTLYCGAPRLERSNV